MASHQQRRAPLPDDYQFPTHGVDCDCPPCRMKTVMPYIVLGVPDSPEAWWERTYQQAIDINNRYAAELGLPPLEPTADTPWGI